MGKQRDLNLISITALSISAHYGLGFLSATSETVMLHSVFGSLYAIIVGLGIILLTPLVNKSIMLRQNLPIRL